MSFRFVAVVTAAILLVLGLGYLLAGTLLVARWQIQPTAAVLLLGRRIGALYLGLSVMFFLAAIAVAMAYNIKVMSFAVRLEEA